MLNNEKKVIVPNNVTNKPDVVLNRPIQSCLDNCDGNSPELDCDGFCWTCNRQKY